MRSSSTHRALRRGLPLWLCLAGCGLGPCSQPAPKPREDPGAARVPRVLLRYQPGEDLQHTMHMVYDLYVPGKGVLRTALSMDVEFEREAGDTRVTSHEVTSYTSLVDRKATPVPAMIGMRFREVRRPTGALVSEPLERSSGVPPALSRSVIEYMKIGTLLEFPQRAVAEGQT